MTKATMAPARAAEAEMTAVAVVIMIVILVETIGTTMDRGIIQGMIVVAVTPGTIIVVETTIKTPGIMDVLIARGREMIEAVTIEGAEDETTALIIEEAGGEVAVAEEVAGVVEEAVEVGEVAVSIFRLPSLLSCALVLTKLTVILI